MILEEFEKFRIWREHKFRKEEEATPNTRLLSAHDAKLLSNQMRAFIELSKTLPIIETEIYNAILKGETKAYVGGLGYPTQEQLDALVKRNFRISKVTEEYFSGYEVNWEQT